jgi:hypothetical protein
LPRRLAAATFLTSLTVLTAKANGVNLVNLVRSQYRLCRQPDLNRCGLKPASDSGGFSQSLGFLSFYSTRMLSSGFFMGTLGQPEIQKVLFASRNIRNDLSLRTIFSSCPRPIIMDAGRRSVDALWLHRQR